MHISGSGASMLTVIGDDYDVQAPEESLLVQPIHQVVDHRVDVYEARLH